MHRRALVALLAATLAGVSHAGTATLRWQLDPAEIPGVARFDILNACGGGALVAIASIPAPANEWIHAGIADDAGHCIWQLQARGTGDELLATSNEAAKDFWLSLAAPGPVLNLDVDWSVVAMTFPARPASYRVQTSFGSAVTSHNVVLPTTLNSGDLILILFSSFESSAGTTTVTNPSGWTELVNNDAVRNDVLLTARVSDGTEGGSSVNVVTSTARTAVAQAIRITGWFGTISTGVAVAFAEVETTSSPPHDFDSPNLAPGWGALDILWGSMISVGDDNEAVDAFPTNYSDGLDGQSGVGNNLYSSVASSWRELNASSEDPGPTSWDGSVQGTGITIAIRPAAGHAPLVGASGSYTLTGTAVAFKAARKLPAASGSYVQTGTAAAFKRTAKLPAATGAYAITGATVAFKAARKLVAATGAYAITGTAAAFKAARKLAAAAGSYALTGTAAALTYTPASGPTATLTADAGTYALTGADAALAAAHALQADAGAYSITGTDAAFKAARQLVADTGAYDLTGADAALAAAHALQADTDAYALTGATVALTSSAATATLTAEAGSYAQTGASVAFKASRALVAAAGAYAITGATAILSKGQTLAAAAGAYVQTGAAVAFKAARQLVADAAAYLLTGTDANLTHGRTLFYYLDEVFEMTAELLLAARGNTDVTVDLGGAGETAGVRAIRQERSFDPAIGQRFFMSTDTEFLIAKLTAPAGLAPGTQLFDETNSETFDVRRVTYNRGGLITVAVNKTV